MDNKSLTQIINNISILKHKYLGAYAANQVPFFVQNSFAIINTDPSYLEGSHWILLAKNNGKMYYADSLGQDLLMYRHIKAPPGVIPLITTKIQQMEFVCGLYCILFAWSIFSGYLPISSSLTDLDMLQFIHKYT